MADEEEAERLEMELLEQEMERKAEELRVLAEMRLEGGFTPRAALTRTPPQALSTPPQMELLVDLATPPAPTVERGEKRTLSSPEEVQEAVRRRLGVKRAQRTDVPPIGGLLTRSANSPSPPPREKEKEKGKEKEKEKEKEMDEGRDGASDTIDPLTTAPVESLAGLATASTRGIMEAVRSKTSRLNKDEVAAIGLHTERISAVIVHLTLRLAAAESRVGAAERKADFCGSALPAAAAAPKPPPAVSYASALRLPRHTEPVLIKSTPGPTLAFYPADENGAIKTAEETKAELKKAVDPTKLWVQVSKVRKVGNAGVLVQTTTDAAATRLRAAIPATLRVAEPKMRQPLVCLNRLDGDPSFEEILEALHEQNYRDDPQWPIERLRKEATGAFKRNRSRGAAKATAAVFACSAALRASLLNKGRVYVGWEAVEVTDYIDVTCCNKCQQYGHPERLCRSVEATCQRCGATGHRGEECTSSVTSCATCKRLGKKGAADHKTASKDCPARHHAEQRSVAMTNYG